MEASNPAIPQSADPGAPADGGAAADADRATASDPAVASALARGEALAGKLAGHPGPAHRRAYLGGLLRSGMRFLRSGNARSAAYCLDKVAAALEAEAPASPEAEG